MIYIMHLEIRLTNKVPVVSVVNLIEVALVRKLLKTVEMTSPFKFWIQAGR